ncbi:MAG TPA: DUF885 domain-containing protein [Kofleriaceae bacterium]|nr:DUF885 domain-containing protein [Kofleriaceae bacterium]
MPKAVLSLFVLLLATPAAAGDNTSKLDALVKRYLEGLLRAKPHLATFMGDHRFDGTLPDLSQAGEEKRVAELLEQQRELEAIVKAGDLANDARANDARVDAQIVSDNIALELLYLREIREWEWDPRLHDSFPAYDPREIIGQRLSDIIHGDFASTADRRTSVVAELAALPKFLADARAALAHPRGKRHTPRIYLDQAIKNTQGNIDFVKTEVKAFVGEDPALTGALAALASYQKFLETELAPHADGDWRLGAELYAKKFPLALQTKLTPAELEARARTVFAESRHQLFVECEKLHHKLWPTDPIPANAAADPAAQQKIIQRVVDELSKDHAKPDALVAAHGNNLDALRAFIKKHDLLALPPRDTLRVAPMPAFKRGSQAAEYLAPGILIRNPTWHATYYVDPIDPSWPAERVESYLRGQNDYTVQLVAAHEAYPGHHTQYFYSKRNLNPLRAVLWSGPMAEGWAVYGEGLMVDLGWGGARNDRFRVFKNIEHLVSTANTILDIELQSGRMTDDDAIRFMVEQGFQPRAQAEKKLVRAKLDSTQLCQYFLGFDEILALERDYKKKVGPKFKQRTFNEALISHGTLAVRFLRDYLLGPGN